MSKYTKATHFEIDFEGDTIKVSMTRLKRADYLKIVPHIKIDEETKKSTMNMTEKLEFMDVATDMLPKYVKRFEGLHDTDGEEIPFKEVVETTYFMDILSQMVERLFSSSGMDVKISEDQEPDEAVAEAKAEVIKN